MDGRGGKDSHVYNSPAFMSHNKSRRLHDYKVGGMRLKNTVIDNNPAYPVNIRAFSFSTS